MAAPTLLQVMQGIETRLGTISGLVVKEFQPDSVILPLAWVGVPPIPEYRATFGRGRFSLDPTVTVFVSRSDAEVGQRKLAEYADVGTAASIPDAIEADRTLGGVVEECFVASFEPLGQQDAAFFGYFGGVFTLHVTAPGK